MRKVCCCETICQRAWQTKVWSKKTPWWKDIWAEVCKIQELGRMDGDSQMASLLAQRLKRLPPTRETRVRSLGREDPLEKEMATHSSILAWRIPWTEKPGRLQSTGLQRVGHDWATSLHFMGDMQGISQNPSPRTVAGLETALSISLEVNCPCFYLHLCVLLLSSAAFPPFLLYCEHALPSPGLDTCLILSIQQRLTWFFQFVRENLIDSA